jgi:gluconate 5-dehydrogenase
MALTDAMSLRGRNALLLGGSGGIGRSIARTLASLGANVALAARNVERCERIGAEIESDYGVLSVAIAADVSSREGVFEAVDRAKETLGAISVLVFNAGTYAAGEVWEIDPDRWRKVFAVNVDGALFAVQRSFEDLREHSGVVIFVGSVGGMMSFRRSSSKIVPYTTSKAALLHLTRDLAAQLADFNIRVNAIAPGSIDSGLTETLSEAQRAEMEERIPLGRLGEPDDIAGTVAFLATDLSRFMTGQALVLDGGMTLI